MSVSRDGEPKLIRGPLHGSLQRPNEYEVRTTPLPAGPQWLDWLGYFNDQFTGQRRIRGFHDGTKITVECSPEDEAQLIETIDAAIQYANRQLRT